MNKKIWIRVRDHRKVEKKEEKKGFLEKYKDVLGALVSIVTLLGSVYVIMVVLFQFIYAQQAESFYYIEWSYFAKEDLGLAIRLSLVFMLYLLWFLLPLLPSLIERSHNHAVPRTEPNWSGKGIVEIIFIHCLPFLIWDLLFCIVFSSIIVDTINWYRTQETVAFRFMVCLYCALIMACVIQQFILLFIEKRFNIFFYKKRTIIALSIMCIIFFILLYSLPLHLFKDPAVQINPIYIIIVRIIAFILAQFFFFNISSSKPRKNAGGQPKESGLGIIQILGCLLFVLFFLIIIFNLFYIFNLNFEKLRLSNKKYYEIVQLRNTPDCEINGEQKASDSNLQAVILHRGSQILLMNGTIDDGGVEIKSPKDITSSSNLYLDISSYEIQDADKYIFYRKRFASVKRKYGDYLLDKDDEEKK
jgi:membrane protein